MRHRGEPAGAQPVGRLVLVAAILAPEFKEMKRLVAAMKRRGRSG
jgi:hypothetical protein